MFPYYYRSGRIIPLSKWVSGYISSFLNNPFKTTVRLPY
nr:MAG TPA: hypothetical protein [Caudoviricetes sp.]